MDADKLIAILNDEKVQGALSIGADMTAVGNPVGAVVVTAFKEIASISDELRCRYILQGLASGLNQEKFTKDIVNITLHLLLVHLVTCFIMQPLPMNHSISFS